MDAMFTQALYMVEELYNYHTGGKKGCLQKNQGRAILLGRVEVTRITTFFFCIMLSLIPTLNLDIPPINLSYYVGRYVGRQTRWLPLIILNTIHHRVFIFYMLVDNDQQMTPIDFGVTRSKVKVRGHMCRTTFLVIIVSHIT